MQKIRNLFKHEDGFTLIELLVVIAVLGILAAIAIPRMGGITDRAKISAVEANMRNVKNGLEMYYADNDAEYPTSSDLESLIGDLEKYIEMDYADLSQYLDTSSTSYDISTSSYEISVTVADTDPAEVFTISSGLIASP
ncbi:hypothetical protein HSACCH_01298 [Halanaerobium saccharolyticum subsp. saccharolyticum DSM 6643]|uniref:General secretion pathway protein G n=1 Tax=Halanaerobium saccharolyticum subsp. saccharolyticum DSM 6643 TaxID=1293054 RepID=M5E0X7_9FIRM|nr:prepilin-type N-terminal cleavage/methylation domain-containing protein [Halanaerobium saccharolyticum]CCU79392.1 hypothetical protein HSACCH_01298 [Halanaerobium saccharolyticum subsp. saccharolyticum DSM 6643]